MNFFQITIAICFLQLSTWAANQATFSRQLFNTIAQKHSQENIIISPASIQTVLALAYMGAEGNTADELRQGLNLGNSNVSKVEVAKQFANLISKIKNSTEATVKMANRIYLRNGLQLANTFNDLAQGYFDSSAESVDFSEGVKTAEEINKWVEEQTENKIRNLIESVEADTVALLVNALYFKAKWLNIFDSTSKKNFHLSKLKKKKVNMMHQKDEFHYAEVLDLNAKALSLAYVGTDIKMLILLPNELDGLSRLEQIIKMEDLTTLLPKLYLENIELSLPKFKFEFGLSLKSSLNALGMQELFSSSADFSSLIANGGQFEVSDVVHKAFIEVNENGTVAAGATGVKFDLMSERPEPHYLPFKVDHPFYFALIDSDTVYFVGHVVSV